MWELVVAHHCLLFFIQVSGIAEFKRNMLEFFTA